MRPRAVRAHPIAELIPGIHTIARSHGPSPAEWLSAHLPPAAARPSRAQNASPHRVHARRPRANHLLPVPQAAPLRNQPSAISPPSRSRTRPGVRIVAGDHRRAPSTRFPGDRGQLRSRFADEHASELGVDPARVAVGGDSARAATSPRCRLCSPAGDDHRAAFRRSAVRLLDAEPDRTQLANAQNGQTLAIAQNEELFDAGGVAAPSVEAATISRSWFRPLVAALGQTQPRARQPTRTPLLELSRSSHGVRANPTARSGRLPQPTEFASLLADRAEQDAAASAGPVTVGACKTSCVKWWVC